MTFRGRGRPKRVMHPAIDRTITELRRERLAQHLTQTQTAKRAGAAQSMVGKLEARDKVEPTWWTLVQVAEALGLELTIQVKRKPNDHVLP